MWQPWATCHRKEVETTLFPFQYSTFPKRRFRAVGRNFRRLRQPISRWGYQEEQAAPAPIPVTGAQQRPIQIRSRAQKIGLPRNTPRKNSF